MQEHRLGGVPRDFPRRCLPTHTSARGPVRTDPTPLFLFAGKLWVTAPAGDFAICPLGPREEESAALHPLPLHHHFGYSAGTCFGVPTDFQEGPVPLSDPSSSGYLCLQRRPFAHDPTVPRALREWRGRDAGSVGDRGDLGGTVPGGGASGEGLEGAQSNR